MYFLRALLGPRRRFAGMLLGPRHYWVRTTGSGPSSVTQNTYLDPIAYHFVFYLKFTYFWKFYKNHSTSTCSVCKVCVDRGKSNFNIKKKNFYGIQHILCQFYHFFPFSHRKSNRISNCTSFLLIFFLLIYVFNSLNYFIR